MAIALFAGVYLFAGDPSMPGEHKTPMCCVFMEKFDLFTPAQKEKAMELHKVCDKAGCTEAAQKEFFKSVKALLTPEQIKQCYANCEKADRKGCPICGYGMPKEKTP
jgi:hypothetical protein